MEKNKGGRPPKYKTREELQAKIDEYFDSCQNRPYTIMGLALALGMTRETLCQYAKDGRFSDIVKKAKQTVEMYVEEMLLEGKNAAGPIFWLKNHAEYRDKTEQEVLITKPLVVIHERSSRKD